MPLIAALALLGACVGSIPVSAQAPPSLGVAITTYLGDEQTFRQGDLLTLFLSLERDAYVVVLYQDAGGTLTQLVPNTHDRRGFYRAGRFIGVPAADDPFTLRVDAPFGEERVWVFASDAPLLRPGGLDPGPVMRPDLRLDLVREQLRAQALRAGSRFGEAQVRLRTESR